MNFTLGLPSGLDIDYRSLEERYTALFLEGAYYLRSTLFPRKRTKLLQSKSKQPRVIKVKIYTIDKGRYEEK